MAGVIAASAFIGGTTGCLDAIDGNDVTVGSSFAMVFDGGKPKTYEYISTTDTENSPYLIRPDTNGTGKAWRQCNIISGNATLYITSTGNDSTGNGTVYAPWATLGKAISWLADKEILATAIVTISIGAGTFVEAGLITIAGNVFKNVKIVGAGSSSTTLSWSAAGTGGLLIENTTTLADLKNIKLYGDGTNGNGIAVQRNAAAYLSADVLVDNFSTGVYVAESSSFFADSALTSTNHAAKGLIAIYSANASIQSCTFSGNGTEGVYSNYNSFINAGSAASNSNNYGFYANRNSFIDGTSSTATGNTVAGWSPAKQTADDPTFANKGSWIYG